MASPLSPKAAPACRSGWPQAPPQAKALHLHDTALEGGGGALATRETTALADLGLPPSVRGQGKGREGGRGGEGGEKRGGQEGPLPASIPYTPECGRIHVVVDVEHPLEAGRHLGIFSAPTLLPPLLCGGPERPPPPPACCPLAP